MISIVLRSLQGSLHELSTHIITNYALISLSDAPARRSTSLWSSTRKVVAACGVSIPLFSISISFFVTGWAVVMRCSVEFSLQKRPIDSFGMFDRPTRHNVNFSGRYWRWRYSLLAAGRRKGSYANNVASGSSTVWNKSIEHIEWIATIEDGAMSRRLKNHCAQSSLQTPGFSSVVRRTSKSQQSVVGLSADRTIFKYISKRMFLMYIIMEATFEPLPKG